MSESLLITGTTREEKYKSLLPQLVALTDGENDLVANASNIVGALKQAFGFFWVGIYFVKKDQLVLGPFQGPIACTRISKGKGVCGSAWEKKQTIIVEDVDKFPGHIACSSDSKSEIVVPVFSNDGKVCAVIDVDSDQLSDFNSTDAHYLEEVAGLLSILHSRNDS
ncbi:MAG TPA: GAF domain-containing protein [Bacteroidia bacterium]|jgi:GAF domain-containing protein|nr:GAF domain-containing protein [Bacteroidia bacterium]